MSGAEVFPFFDSIGVVCCVSMHSFISSSICFFLFFVLFLFFPSFAFYTDVVAEGVVWSVFCFGDGLVSLVQFVVALLMVYERWD